jgi:hypothetical protein
MLTALPTEAVLMTYGLGANLTDLLQKGLELFFEIYFQNGTISKTAAGDLDAGGIAFEFGVKYAFDMKMHPWFELKITSLSGDSDQSATDDEVDAFVGYGYNDDLMIVFNPFFGLYWYTNFLGILLSGGADFSLGGGTDNLHVKFVLGILKTNEDVRNSFVPTETTDKLGNELDIIVTYDYSKQVQLILSIGMLFGSEVLEFLSGGSADADSADSSMIFSFGLHGKF